MSAEKMFTFFVMNNRTKEIATFLGQGKTLEAAAADAVETVTGKFGADSSGGGVVLPLNVRLPDGRYVARSIADFEGDAPFEGVVPVRVEPAPEPPEEDCPA
jgi:hypothetical protein